MIEKIENVTVLKTVRKTNRALPALVGTHRRSTFLTWYRVYVCCVHDWIAVYPDRMLEKRKTRIVETATCASGLAPFIISSKSCVSHTGWSPGSRTCDPRSALIEENLRKLFERRNPTCWSAARTWISRSGVLILYNRSRRSTYVEN